MAVPNNVQAIVADRLSNKRIEQSSDLPTTFPEVENPYFVYGDLVRWISDRETTDWGIVIGQFYSFAPHCDRWQWCYLIWLKSASAAWVKADVAWEDDLEACDETAADLSNRGEAG